MPGNIDIVDTVWKARKEVHFAGRKGKAQENRQLFRRLTLSHTLSYFKLSDIPPGNACNGFLYVCTGNESRLLRNRKEGRKEGSFGLSDSLISLVRPRKYTYLFHFERLGKMCIRDSSV